MKRLHIVLMVLMNIVWSSSFSVYKWLGDHLTTGPVVTLRFGLAAMALGLVWTWLPGKAPVGRDLVRALVMGVIVFCLAPRLQVEGVQRGQASDGSVLMALDPLVTCLAASLFLREHVAARRWTGFALGMAGVLVMSRSTAEGLFFPGLVANLLILGSFVSETAYSVIGKPILARAGIFKVLGVALLAGSAANLLLDAPALGPSLAKLPWLGWWLLAYLALILTVAGYALWYAVIKEADVNVVALTIYVQPVAGVVIAVVWLGESLHGGQLWGSVVIVAGLLVGLWEGKKPRAAPSALPPGEPY
jgi:drug/metabolite transporter (DMT)-like permease